MVLIFIALIISYLIGSIPTAYLFGKALKGVDIRKVGSGNVGATNALRVLGRKAGITVLLLDIIKGFVTVVVLGSYFADKVTLLSNQNLCILMGLFCICGHNWTIFLQFKGGKGIATTFGVLIGLSLKVAGLNFVIGILILVWFIVFFAFRMVSLASICSAIAFPAASFFLKQSPMFVYLSLLLSIFVVFRHKSNLVRIFQGKESRLYFKKSEK
ncbi:MAG TPA: glycerol-3-phosphate 1-O-acyltransferase PlsY [Candidatus Omnitrophota bacterium]|nr:glycerol-3-phosphate 1-O-acyltransferase PlsY [Candidatus Omnitrophota bacterium]HPT38922.1 glycerol-3-phosphate 1-O-acyltransferase PlsY [Candidatus Omnitrophota bacterium]